MVRLAIAGALLLSACTSEVQSNERAPTYTLYRNSDLFTGLRIHWATFDVNDRRDYNRNNCEMAARVLNANHHAMAEKQGKPPADVGFWCEMGTYSEEGEIPDSFETEFPTNVY